MKWIDYREKLGIGFNDQAKFKMLLNVLNNYVANVLGRLYDETSYLNYCQMVGEPYYSTSLPYHRVVDSLHDCRTMEELISKFIAVCNTCETLHNGYRRVTRNDILTCLKEALDNLNIGYDVLSDKDGDFLFPKGAKELDDALVSKPLEWLEDYPNTHKAFVKALKVYSESTEENASDVADLFRKALESFFQEFFGGERSLEKYVEDRTYERYLDQQGVPVDLRGEFENTVKMYTKFNNNNAKHHDKTTKNVLEYLLYQTGNIIRFLITLERAA